MQSRAPNTLAQRARHDALSPRRTPPAPPPGPIARITVHALSRVPVETRGRLSTPPPTISFANLRRNVCPHFYMTGARGTISSQAPHMLKAYMRQDANVSRCQLRGGVHLEQGYVSDVCLSARFNQCVFYEDELSRS